MNILPVSSSESSKSSRCDIVMTLDVIPTSSIAKFTANSCTVCSFPKSLNHCKATHVCTAGQTKSKNKPPLVRSSCSCVVVQWKYNRSHPSLIKSYKGDELEYQRYTGDAATFRLMHASRSQRSSCRRHSLACSTGLYGPDKTKEATQNRIRHAKKSNNIDGTNRSRTESLTHFHRVD